MNSIPTSLTFDERLRYTINEASTLLRQSRAKTYIDMQDGKLHVIRDGKRVYIPGTEIVRRSKLPNSVAA